MRNVEHFWSAYLALHKQSMVKSVYLMDVEVICGNYFRVVCRTLYFLFASVVFLSSPKILVMYI